MTRNVWKINIGFEIPTNRMRFGLGCSRWKDPRTESNQSPVFPQTVSDESDQGLGLRRSAAISPCSSLGC